MHAREVEEAISSLKEEVEEAARILRDLRDERARLVAGLPLGPRAMLEGLRAHALRRVLDGRDVSFWTPESGMVTAHLENETGEGYDRSWKVYVRGSAGGYECSERESHLRERIAAATMFEASVEED